MNSLHGHHALVCGGSQGIGLAAAQALAASGARVTLLARTEATLRAAVGTLPGEGHGVLVADASQPEALVQAVQAGDKMDFTIQKAVELGVAGVVPGLGESPA